MIFLVAVVMSQRLVVSQTMTFPQVALVISLFLPPVMAFLVTIVMLRSWFSRPAQVFLRCVASEEMATVTLSLVSEVTAVQSASLMLVVVKAMLLPSAVSLLVVLLVYLAMHCSASQQLFHLDGRQLGHTALIT